MAGDAKVHEVVEAVKSSPYWQRTLIVVTFDEHGGFWDPIAPPVIDRWGPGSRIPAVFISPHVRERHVDHTLYETVSILAFLEKRFDLKPLSERDAKASPLTGIFKD
jgi:phospholipase C